MKAIEKILADANQAIVGVEKDLQVQRDNITKFTNADFAILDDLDISSTHSNECHLHISCRGTEADAMLLAKKVSATHFEWCPQQVTWHIGCVLSGQNIAIWMYPSKSCKVIYEDTTVKRAVGVECEQIDVG